MNALAHEARSHVVPRLSAERTDEVERGLPSALRHLLPYRRSIIVALHLLLVVAANYLAFLLRFDGTIPPGARAMFLQVLPWLVLFRAITFVPFRLYQGLWRYTGLWELQQIFGAVVVSSLICQVFIHQWLELSDYPRSITVVDSLLLMCMVGGVRLSGRLWAQLSPAKGRRRVLIVGAGDPGETIVRDMKRRHVHEPVGFVDDDRNKVGQRIHGVPVLGMRDDLPRLVSEYRPQEVLIAVPSADPVMVQEVVQALRPFRVGITTLPSRSDIQNGVAATQVRDLAIEDLLTRAPVGLDERPLRRLIEGRRVMVTGAGGSIGSELCRQIAALFPADLVLYERYENSLFAIATDLTDCGAGGFIYTVIGDVTDVTRLDAVMIEHRPEIIFHAAAHKHVPLMEHNPCEAVKNNVTGTRLLVEAAERHGVSRFIFISSDKAVNPTSVMGATKRIVELLLQTRVAGPTSFSIVRFGNVLGSNGSVVPRFLDQIRAGGPVTITHPEIRRYFMLIPEAVHLVLHAAAQKTPGLVYVLEMGAQIKLVDLARNLIRLGGFVPDEEIQLTFVGLRPGEKLFEELVGPNEQVGPSPVEKILQVTLFGLPDPDQLAQQISVLERLAVRGDGAATVKQIGAIVAEFNAQAPPPARLAVPAPETPLTEAGSLADEARPDHGSWPGWGAPVQQTAPRWLAESLAPDFGSIDLVIHPHSAALRRPFSPHDLL